MNNNRCYLLVVALLVVHIPIWSQYNKCFSDSLFTVGVNYYHNGEYKRAINTFLECDEYDKSLLSENSARLAYCKMWIGSCYYKLGDEIKAKEYDSKYYKYIPIDRNLTSKSDSLSDIYYKLIEYGEQVRSRNYLHKILEAEIKELGKNNYWIANTYEILGTVYEELDSIKTASQYFMEAYSIRSRVFDDKHPDVATSMIDIAYCRDYLGIDTLTAINYYLQGFKILYDNNLINDLYCASRLHDMAGIYKKLSRIDDAIKYELISLNIYEYLYNNKQDVSTDLIRAYNTLIDCYDSKEDFANVIVYGKKCIKIKKEVGCDKTSNYGKFLFYFARINYLNGNYIEASLYTTEYLTIIEELYGDKSPEYIECLINSSAIYLQIDDKTSAMNTIKKAIDIIEKNENNKLGEYIPTAYINYVPLLIEAGEYESASQKLKECICRLKREGKTNSRVMVQALLKLGDIYIQLCDSSMALSCFTSAEKIQARINRNSIDYLYCLEALADNNKELSNCILWRKRLLDSCKELKKDNSPFYAVHLACQSFAQISLLFDSYDHSIPINNYIEKNSLFVDSLICDIKISSDILKAHLCNTLCYLSSKQRRAYLSKYIGLFTKVTPAITELLNLGQMNAVAYDAVLFSKGLLFRTDKSIKEKALSANNEIDTLYNSYVNEISDYLKNDSLHEKNNINNNGYIKGTDFLLSQHLLYHDYSIRQETYTWKDVQNCLNESEVAIEFIGYKAISYEPTRYLALVLRKDMDYPKVIFLGDDDELKSIIQKVPSCTMDLSKWIWNDSLLELLNGIKTIFFSASDILNVLGIEYLPLYEHTSMFDNFSLYRLSSTGDICKKRQITIYKHAKLYGGLNYDDKEEEINLENHFQDSNNVVKKYNDRGGFETLYETEEEVEIISKTLLQHGVDVDVLKGKNGTEDTFKKISQTNVDIIHIATHGKYVNSHETEEMKDEMNMSFELSDNSYFDKMESSMIRSFLLMSGSNIHIRREPTENGKDDGFLTALEISLLDLCNVDIVVLSACQTGMGDVDSEGVYGLQRGFKKAGVNTILMSLDKVDDEATKILMVEFYRNLMSGKTKHQSLKNAQKYLRQVENGKYDDPKYWASFILLDGLN